jgi:hypothetical protein
MTRPIISGEQFQNPPATQTPAPQVQAQAPLAPAQPRDTLAGAFPAWDLVPTVHFIRRVK